MELRLERENERRQAWLSALEADSARWIPEARIDELITPEVFSMKHAWQYERWFEVKERKKSMAEAARRAKKAGQPLREILVEDADRPFDEAWESDGEAGDGVAAARPVAAALADADAAADGSGAVAAALALARDAAVDRDRAFPEPALDADGNAVNETSDRVRRMRAAAGYQVRGVVVVALHHSVTRTHAHTLSAPPPTRSCRSCLRASLRRTL